MTKYNVVLVPFPFDDLSAMKVRPAVCLTDRIGPHNQVVVAFLSSQRPHPLLATDVTIDMSHADFAATGLRHPSTLRLHRLMTVTTSIIQRKLGELTGSLRSDVDAKLRILFDLP